MGVSFVVVMNLIQVENALEALKERNRPCVMQIEIELTDNVLFKINNFLSDQCNIPFTANQSNHSVEVWLHTLFKLGGH